MRIDLNHLYHGAALLQISEDPRFTAINSITLAGGPSKNAYEVQKQTRGRAGVYLKYASAPTAAYGEYVFNFAAAQLAELDEVTGTVTKLYLGLICVAAHQICGLPYTDFLSLVAGRKARKGAEEASYTLLVTCEEGKSFRVYMNVPGVKNTKFGELVISRNAFPGLLFK